MEILDKKSNRMSRANAGVFECNEFPDLQRILDFLSLRNLLSNELFFTFYEFATAPSFFMIKLLFLLNFYDNVLYRKSIEIIDKIVYLRYNNVSLQKTHILKF